MRSSLLRAVVQVSAACAVAAPGLGQDALSHDPVGCLVAGQYPRLTACVAEPDGVAQARVFFRAAGTPAWYHVVMERDAACFAGVLPRPKRELVGRRVDYYVEVEHRRLGSPRTAESHPLVVRSSGECGGPLVAAIAASGPAAVLPALPSGFAAGGLGAGTIAAVVGGGLAAGGAAVAVGGGGGSDAAEPAPPATTLAPVTTTPAPATTVPATTPVGPDPLAVTCEARPDTGPVPLAVQFQATVRGGSAPATLQWDFGDGSGADAAVVEHVYRTAGRFEASVRATAAGQSERCVRVIAAAVTPARRFALTIGLSGAGQGGVTSSPGGIDCAPTCAAEFEEGTSVRLTARAAAGSTFRGWSGACGGTGTCTLAMTSAQAATATFDPAVAPKQTLTVQVTGSGTGAVTSSPPGIDCPADCDEAYAAGAVVALTAQPKAGSTFAGWGGACGGNGGCSVTLDVARTVTARFDPPAPATFPLSVTLAGRGTGTVVGQGINCPGDCNESYPQGTAVNITATASGPQSTFSGWEQGDCFLMSNICQLTMNGAKTARARFDAQFRLDVTVQGPGHVTGSGINCPPTCTVIRVDGAIETLTGQASIPGGLVNWAGDCSGASPTCNVTMDQNRSVIASFPGAATQPERPAALTTWTSRLDGDAAGTLRAGTFERAFGPGSTLFTLPAPAGDVQVELALSRGPAAVWRLETLGPGVEKGTLRVLAGEALEVGVSAVAFRLRPGERAAFAFRSR